MTETFAGQRLIRLPEVLQLTGLSRTTVYRKIKLSQFPEPIQLGERSVAWRASDILAWIDTRPLVSQAT